MNKRPDEMIENIRKSKQDLTIVPKEFAKAIKKAC